MIETKYNIGDTVYLPWKVTKITTDGTTIWYALEYEYAPNPMTLGEGLLDDVDCIPLKEYEAEIDDLKDEINRLREMYQLEHLKALKLKNEPCRGMDSHHPTPNIYADDWRMP